MRKGRTITGFRENRRWLRDAVADFATGLLIFLAVFLLAALDTFPARSGPAAPPPMTAKGSPPADARAPLAFRVPRLVPPATAQPREIAAEDISGKTTGRNAPWRRAEREPLARHEELPASFWSRMPAVALMALLFAAMSALTLGMWRHLRRLYVSPSRVRRGMHGGRGRTEAG